MLKFKSRSTAYALTLLTLLLLHALPALCSLHEAAEKFKAELGLAYTPFKAGMLIVAGIFAIVGLAKAKAKNNTEHENAAKNYGGWFLGFGIFFIGWACLQYFES